MRPNPQTQLAGEPRVAVKLQKYVDDRAAAVARGAETPAMAALLLQTYGNGLLDAAAEILGDKRAADPIRIVLEEAVMHLDPDWREHCAQRRDAVSVGVAILAANRPILEWPVRPAP